MSPLLPRFRGLLYPAQVLLRGRQWAGMPSLQPHAVRTPSFFCSLGLGARITALFFFFFFNTLYYQCACGTVPYVALNLLRFIPRFCERSSVSLC